MEEKKIKGRTIIRTEYAPCGLTKGKWRPLSALHFDSKEAAERALERDMKIKNEHPNMFFNGFESFKIMTRTVVTTFGDWEDI